MRTLRRFRTLGRLLAAWCLLWFGAMAAAPLFATHPHGRHGPHEAHARHDAPFCGHGGLSCDEEGSAPQLHCPVCMQAAAPPLAQLPAVPPGVEPAGPRPASARSPVQARAAVLPPARAPPALS